MIRSLVKKLESDDNDMKRITVELFETLAQYGASVFMSLLLLLTILLDKLRALIVKRDVAVSVVEMIGANDNDVRSTAVRLLKQFAGRGRFLLLLFCY